MSMLPQPHNVSKGIISWFGHNHVAANILMMLFLVGGIFTLSNMRTETFPSIDPKMVTVRVAYPGATPYEVADGITSRIEEALIGIDGVKRISAVASEGSGSVYVELEDFANPDDVYNEVDTAVNGLSDFPPEEAERPIVTKLKPTPLVMTLAIYGDAKEETIKYWAENIEDELRQLPGVAHTNLRGIRDYEISIEVSEDNLRKYDLSLSEIGNAIKAFSTDIPAGTLEAQQGEILLRVQEQRYSGAEFENIVLKTLPNGSSLRLKDVATVIDGFEDANLISRFNGARAAFIDVSRSETEDTLGVANTVNAYLDTVTLPAGLNLVLQQDETVVLRDRINLMLRNGILGFALVFLVLLLFLDLKLAFWTSVAIPVSFMGGLMVIYFFGYSLNMVSLFALIVVLGIVVDYAIVTGESIFDQQEKHPDDPDAFLIGVRRVYAPVTVGVSTTIAAFAPLYFSTGILGQIISVIPVVVVPILAISLIEA
ncbi:MAG: efflux RND transporter permease subunit, partial [Pseudomonadota bacterium]|nr:efflux RND transporter permease subunit [Pseudomonadota bacterium]